MSKVYELGKHDPRVKKLTMVESKKQNVPKICELKKTNSYEKNRTTVGDIR